MPSLRLLSIAAYMLFVADGALAYTVPECAHAHQTLCHLLRSAHLQNVVAETLLKGSHSLKDGVSLANQAVSKALMTTDLTGLFGVLKEALHLQNAVLSQFKLPCETDESCSKAQLSLMQTLLHIVNAIMEAVEIQKGTIKQALEAFQSGSENLTDRSCKMAADVLAVI